MFKPSFSKRVTLLLWLLFCLPWLDAWAASDASVRGVRVSSNPEYTRVVLDLDGPVSHSLFTLSNPERVVLDVKSAKLLKLPGDTELKNSKSLRSLRSATRNKSDLRLSLIHI